MKGLITEIQRFCVDDGPGIRTTVFFKGCPLRCPWCHNPETHEARIEQGYGREVEAPQIITELMRDVPFYRRSGGGVTIGGGEPFMQPGFLMELLAQCKLNALHTAVETSGAAPWDAMSVSLPLIDLLLFDYKLTDADALTRLTGADSAQIMSNLEYASAANVPIALRLPIIPGINDAPGHIAAALALRERISGIVSIEILPYHNTGEAKWKRLGREYTMSGTPVPTARQVQLWRTLAR